MTISGANVGVSCAPVTPTCPDQFGCTGVCPDFVVKRYDNQPPFRVSISDCDGALDLTDTTLILEANIWANAKLKANVMATDTYFSVANNIGFNQMNVGDIIIVDRVRLPEHMLITGFDEANNYVQVQRGYDNTTATSWKKGTPIRIMRAINSSASIELVYNDVLQVDGTTINTLTDSFLVYNWNANDTCLPGCYMLEFKLIKMTGSLSLMAQDTLSTTTVADFTTTVVSQDCTLGTGVQWIRRFPTSTGAFLIQILDTPTAE